MNKLELAIKRRVLRGSLYAFMKEFLGEVDNGVFYWNWHIEYLCERLQEIVFRYIEIKRLTGEYYTTGDAEVYKRLQELKEDNKPLNVNICPASTKSTIFSRVLRAWVWANDPSLVMILVTRSDGNVTNFSEKTRNILESKMYKALFPEVVLSGISQVKYFENDRGGICYTYTTTSKENTGKHADIIIFDDVQVHTDLENMGERERTEKSVDGFLSRFKDKDSGLLLNVMQRLGQKDMTNYLFEGDKYNTPKYEDYWNICLPAEENRFVYPDDLRLRYVDGLMDSVRLNENVLKKERVKMGRNYSTQYLQNPVPPVESLMYPTVVMAEFDIESLRVDANVVKISVTDLKDMGDDTYCTMITGVKGNKIYVLDVIYNKRTKDENEAGLIYKCKYYKCIRNIFELNNQQSYVRTTLRMNLGLVVGIQTTKNKEAKIRDASHFVLHYVWHSNHPNMEYRDALEHFRSFPSDCVSDDDGIEDVFSMSADYHFENFKGVFYS